MNELRRILIALREKYGKSHFGKIHRTEYMRIDKTDRKTVMYYLVKTMQLKCGKDRSYFEGSAVQREIVDFFFPDEAIEGMAKSKLKSGKAVALIELESVIERVWPTADLFDGPIAEPQTVQAPEYKDDSTASINRKEVDWKQIEKEAGKYEKPELDEDWAKLMGLEND